MSFFRQYGKYQVKRHEKGLPTVALHQVTYTEKELFEAKDKEEFLKERREKQLMMAATNPDMQDFVLIDRQVRFSNDHNVHVETVVFARNGYFEEVPGETQGVKNEEVSSQEPHRVGVSSSAKIVPGKVKATVRSRNKPA